MIPVPPGLVPLPDRFRKLINHPSCPLTSHPGRVAATPDPNPNLDDNHAVSHLGQERMRQQLVCRRSSFMIDHERDIQEITRFAGNVVRVGRSRRRPDLYRCARSRRTEFVASVFVFSFIKPPIRPYDPP